MIRRTAAALGPAADLGTAAGVFQGLVELDEPLVEFDEPLSDSMRLS